jgi:hypothetical protein
MAQCKKAPRPYYLTCEPRYDPPRAYDLMRLPALAKAGGAAWASDFAALPAEEQRAIVTRMIAERSRCAARRAGRPDPLLYEATVKPLKGGGCELVSTVPLRPEWGGDGRTLEDALREAKDPVYRASLKLAQVAERHKARLEALGFEVVVAPRQPEPEPRPKRKARTA